MDTNWKNDPLLKGMNKEKLEFLTTFASQAQSSKKEALLPLLLSVTSQANSKGISFSNTETDLLVRILSSNMTPAQKQQLDGMRKMADTLAKRQKKS